MFRIKVPETQVHVGAQALHRMNAERTAQIFGIRSRCWQSESVTVHWSRGAHVHVLQHVAEQISLHQLVVGLFCCAEVVFHHFVKFVLGDTTSSIRDSKEKN